MCDSMSVQRFLMGLGILRAHVASSASSAIWGGVPPEKALQLGPHNLKEVKCAEGLQLFSGLGAGRSSWCGGCGASAVVLRAERWRSARNIGIPRGIPLRPNRMAPLLS